MKSIYLLNFAEVGTTKDRKQWREMRLGSPREDCAVHGRPCVRTFFSGLKQVCVFLYVCVCVYLCMCVCECVYIWVFVCMFMCIFSMCLCICVCCVCACVYCQHSGKSLK